MDIGLVDGVDWLLGLAGGDGPGLIVVRCRFVSVFAAGLGNMGRLFSTTSLGDNGHAGGTPLTPAEKSSAVTIIASLLNLFLFTGATDDVPCDAFVKNRAWKA